MRYINWEDPFGLNYKERTEEPVEDFAITIKRNNMPHVYKEGGKAVSPYRYMQDDKGSWNRVTNDNMGRMFQGLVVTPNKSHIRYVPERIDNSLEGSQARDKFFQYRKSDGTIIGEPGLKTVSPEFNILSLSPLMSGIGKRIVQSTKSVVENIKDLQALRAFNTKYGYSAITPKNSIIFNNKRLDDVFDYTVKRHNTFVRGVDPHETQKFGRLLDKSPEEAAEYSMTHIPRVYKGNNAGLLPDENGLYVSNDFQTATGYANEGSGYVGIVRRPIKYGQPTRRQFLEENDFVFSRPPGRERQFYTTTDEPNIPWLTKDFDAADSYITDWSKTQPFEVRANAGARVVERGDPHFRHYIFVGDVGKEPVELIDMFKPVTYGTKAHKGVGAVGLSRKKDFGGHLK